MLNQKIVTASGETLIVLTLADYESLCVARDATRSQARGEAVRLGTMPTLTVAQTKALLDAPSPLSFWRKTRGLTQQGLAGRAGLSQSHVAGLEAGDRKGDAALVKRLAAILDLPMEALVD